MRKTAGAGGRKTRVDHDTVGDVPRMATVNDFMGSNPVTSGRKGAGSRTSKGKGGPEALPKINLKAVAEALVDEGLDLSTEIARVLKGVPVLDADGNPVLDPRTGQPVMQHLVDADTRLRTMNTLLEFVQPKLKAVEVKMSGSLDLTNEQLDQRLAMLLGKVQL